MLYLQLYRLLFGEASVADTRERIRHRRDTADISSEFSDGLHEHLSDIPGLVDTKTSFLPGASTSLIDQLLAAGHVPTDGIIYQLIRDNPKLLLNPEIRRLVIRMLEAAGRHEMDSFLESYDFTEVITLLKVTCHTCHRLNVTKTFLRFF